MLTGRPDELGAHVSAAGGPELAPGRAAELGAHVLQLFTKQPNRWAEPTIPADTAAAFREARLQHNIRVAAAHDSYLINLASPDPVLLNRSAASFSAELERCETLGLELLVTHPGHATDGDATRGLAANADAIDAALDRVPGTTHVLLETTAGSGSALGASFQELAELVSRIGQRHPDRIGVCIDTCHIWAAGYDLRNDYDAVIDDLDRTLGLEHVRLFHLNDSVGDLGSRRDRHAGIAEGTLGEEPFRRLMNDPRFVNVPKILETPKGDDAPAADRRNLALLRGLRTHRSGRYFGQEP